MLHGIGAQPLYTIGVAFIDESVDPHTSPLYLGQWFLIWVRSDHTGSVSQFQEFGGKRFLAIKIKIYNLRHTFYFSNYEGFDEWNLWSSVPSTRLRTTDLGVEKFTSAEES